VKYQQTTISTEEKLDVLSRIENVNRLLTYGIMSDLLTVVYVQLVILLMELQKVRSQELHCLCRESTTVSSECSLPKIIDVSLLHVYCIRNK